MWSVGPRDVRPKPLCLGLCCQASRAELLLACVLFYFLALDLCLEEEGRGKSKCGTCSGCKRKKGCEGRAMTAVTPNKNGLQWGLVADAEFRSPLETKTTALSVRRTIVTESDKKAKLGENQRRATSLS